MTLHELGKVGSNEASYMFDYFDVFMQAIMGGCKCNSDRACDICVDNELYDREETEQPFNGYMDAEQAAYYEGDAPSNMDA